MADNIIALAEGFRSQLNKHDAGAIMAMTRRWTGIEKALETAVQELAQELADLKAAGETVPQYKLWQMNRYQSLLAQIAGEMAAYGQHAIAEIKDQAAKSQALGEKHAKQMLLGMMGGSRKAAVTFSQLPTGAVENIAAIARGGQPLNNLLKGAYPKAVQGLTNELLYGTAVGRNPRETARAMMKQGLAQGFNHILLVARDQQIRNYREMVRQRYKESGVVYGYMRLAAKNGRTCPACLAQDGTIYQTDQLMALHPQDRCTMVPLVDGFPLPKFQTGAEWFQTLNEDEQRRILGRSRYEAWRDGLFEFKQLATITEHPVWGPSARVTSLTALLDGKGGIGGAPIDPAALLSNYKSAKPQKERKPKTLALEAADTAVIEKLAAQLPDLPYDEATKKGISSALLKIGAGGKGLVYLDAQGRIEGALAYLSGDKVLAIAGAGFASGDVNKKGIVDAAKLALQDNKHLQLYVPNALVDQYKAWGFLTYETLGSGARMRLRANDIQTFLKDPDNFGQVKLQQLSQQAQKDLADATKTAVFQSGLALEGLPFKSVKMTDADFLAATKALAAEPSLSVPADKHAAAGMLLFTPDGKLVLVDPAHKYGGYKTTFPKGTVEDGMGLQATAVKEVWEESGFKANILGYMGDFEKTSSVTRYYIGVVEDGAPWDAHYETAAVQLVPLNKVDARLNTGIDKEIFAHLQETLKMALGDNAFDAGKLEAWLDAQDATQVQTVETAVPPVTRLPLPPEDPAALTKKALVDHLAAQRGIAKWKLGVMTKDEIVALFGLPEAKAIAAIEAAGAAHTAKYSKKAGKADTAQPEAPETAVAKLPLPPDTEDPASLTKKALVDHLAAQRGIAKWKLSVMTKDEIVALFDLPEAEAITAIEAAGAAHSEKYKKTAVPKPVKEAATFTKYQELGVQALSPEEAKAALAYAEQQQFSSVIKNELVQHYQVQIGDPLLLPQLAGKSATKSYLVYQIKEASGIPTYKLNKLKKTELADLLGKPVSEAHQAAGHPFQANVPESQKTAVPEPPKTAEPSPEIPPPNIKLMDDTAKVLLQEGLDAVFTPGTPAGNGAKKAMAQIYSGDDGFAYYDDFDAPMGIVAYDAAFSTTEVKVTGAAFADTDANLEALADVANVALASGKGLITYVPKALLSTYKKWGFKVKTSYDNGSYMTAALGDLPGIVGKAGKTPQKPPQTPTVAKTAVTATVGYPAGISKVAASKLKKDVLLNHLATAAGLSGPDKAKLGKYTKSMLLKFMEMPQAEAVALLKKGAAPSPQASPTKLPAAPKAKQRPLPPDLPAHQLPDPPGFPNSVADMKVAKRLGGSTGAQLVTDPATGKQYVMKKGNNSGHLLEEAYADAAYQALGMNVPTFKIYQTSDGPVKLAEYKGDMQTLSQALKGADTKTRHAIIKEVRRGFAADALLGNWDVVGADMDNILIDGDGRAWRIDNGGSMRYRAQGAKKEKAYLNDYPVELWTMRDKSIGPKNEQVFGALDIYEIMDQVRDLDDKGNQLLAALPEELRPMMHGRLEVMRDLLGTSDSLKGDQWQAGYTDSFLHESTYIRRDGLIDALPQQLKQNKKGSTTVYDENGRKFDKLRGQSSHVEALATYMRANGADPEVIRYWMSHQAGSSWSGASQALKYHIAQSRGGKFNDYYWGMGLDKAKQHYESTVKKIGEEKYQKSFAIWHAWVYESLRHMEFARKSGGYVELVRTEGKDVLNIYGVKKGQRSILMPRGAAESASIYRAKRIVAGGEVTTQRVPLHRVIGYYWTDRPGDRDNSGGFLGDGENEFVFIPEGIPFDYVDSISGSADAASYWN